jgi:hypothetical protein
MRQYYGPGLSLGMSKWWGKEGERKSETNIAIWNIYPKKVGKNIGTAYVNIVFVHQNETTLMKFKGEYVGRKDRRG